MKIQTSKCKSQNDNVKLKIILNQKLLNFTFLIFTLPSDSEGEI